MFAVHARRALGFVSAVITAGAFTGAAPPLVAGAAGSTPNEVGVAGLDSALWRLQDAPPATPFTSLGGNLTAAPAVVSVPDLSGTQPGTPIYIGTGTDHSLWVRSQAQSWRPLVSSPSFCIDNPAGVVVQSKPAGSLIFAVACQGGDHALWFAEEPISPGSLPDPSLVFHSLGGHLVAGPAVAAISPLGALTVDDELTVFVVGLDGHIWTRTPNSPGWTSTVWSCIGHPAVSTVAIPTPTPAFEASVFACQGTNGDLWVAVNLGPPGGWGPAFDAGGHLVDGPGAAADPNGPIVYVEGLDGTVWRWDGTFLSLGGHALHGVGAAALQFLNASASPASWASFRSR
jgi:hypothetical protein